MIFMRMIIIMVKQAPKDKKSNSVGERVFFFFFLSFLTRLIKGSRDKEKV